MAGREIKKICFFGGFAREYPRNDLLRKGLEKLGVEVSVCHTSPRRRGLSRYARLTFRYFKMKRDFRVVFVPEFRHKDVPLAYTLCRLTGKRLVFDPLVSRFDTKIKDRGDAGERSFQAWHNRNLDRLSLALSDIVLADTQAHADYYTREYRTRPTKVRVLPVGFDEDVFTLNGSSQPVKKASQPLRILFFGNYLPLHGVDVIVEAAKLLRDISDIQFLLIGRGQTFDMVEEFVKKEHLVNVRLSDRVPMESLAMHLMECDISLGVFGRTEKAQRVVANKVYQSMALGKPVITADSGAIREFFADGENIVLVQPHDPDDLARKILFFYDRREELGAIGARGAELVHGRYTSRAVASKFLEYCRQA